MESQTFVKEICLTTTQVWVRTDALLVDVREKDEVAQLAFGVPNMTQIPFGEFEAHLTEIPEDRNMVMVC
ncbi:MAG: rhodanese-like domain-containing protein [Saprospiraceae bacterium]|nr:rhodanese-like domain-containing protein [Saprospiraceae bacterium]